MEMTIYAARAGAASLGYRKRTLTRSMATSPSSCAWGARSTISRTMACTSRLRAQMATR